MFKFKFKLNLTEWKTCSPTSTIITVNKLEVLPTVFTIPGNVSMSFDIDVKQAITSPVQVIVIYLKFSLDIFSFNVLCRFPLADY